MKNLQSQGGKDQKPIVWHKSFFGNQRSQQKLEQLAEKLEKFDQRQQQENKLSGGGIAWIVVGCLLGGGLIASLLWFIFYKRKNK